MLTMYILWTLCCMAGGVVSNRKNITEYLEVKRLMDFREQFPDHPMVSMVSDELVTAVYEQKKSKAITALQAIGLLAVWPLTVPFMAGMMFAEGAKFTYKKVAGINKNMAPTITIDRYKIREEEGR